MFDFGIFAQKIRFPKWFQFVLAFLKKKPKLNEYGWRFVREKSFNEILRIAFNAFERSVLFCKSKRDMGPEFANASAKLECETERWNGNLPWKRNPYRRKLRKKNCTKTNTSNKRNGPYRPNNKTDHVAWGDTNTKTLCVAGRVWAETTASIGISTFVSKNSSWSIQNLSLCVASAFPNKTNESWVLAYRGKQCTRPNQRFP